MEYYRRVVTPLLGPTAQTGFILILVIFILLQREKLRDRLIRVFGGEDFERTTAAMTDAAGRLSRFFLTLTGMNIAYGAVIAAVLWLVGIPGSILWGILAGLMRFVPYIGSIIAAVFPVLLAAAVDPGWSLVLVTLLAYVVGEFTMGQVMEPWLLGSSTGLLLKRACLARRTLPHRRSMRSTWVALNWPCFPTSTPRERPRMHAC